MPDALIKQTIQELEDEEFRLEYGEEIAKMDFALALIAARKEYHITQMQLADILGVSQAYVARLESGEANPTIGKVGRIFAATRKRLSWTTIPLAPASDSIPARQVPIPGTTAAEASPRGLWGAGQVVGKYGNLAESAASGSAICKPTSEEEPWIGGEKREFARAG